MSKLDCFVKNCQNEAKYQFDFRVDFNVKDVSDSHTFFRSCEEHLEKASRRARLLKIKQDELIEEFKGKLDQLDI